MCEILNRLCVCEQSNEALNFHFLSYLKMLKFWTKYHFSGNYVTYLNEIFTDSDMSLCSLC